MQRDPQILFYGWKANEWEIQIQEKNWPIGHCDVIILASELKKCIFKKWRHVFLCLSEIISLTSGRFSPKFWYVVVWTILYKKYAFTFHFDDVIIVKFLIKGDNTKKIRFACIVNGRWLFLKTWICMTMFFEPYLAYFCSIFSQISVCYSGHYGLSEVWSQIFN